MARLELVSALVADELCRRYDRLPEAGTSSDASANLERSLDMCDFDFSRKLNRALIYETAALTKPGAAQAIGGAPHRYQ